MSPDTQETPPSFKDRTIKTLQGVLARGVPFVKARPVLSAGIAVALLLAVYLLWPSGSGDHGGMAYHQVTRGDFLVSIVEGGTLKAVNETTVRNEVDGTSRIIYIVPEGTIVKKGDLIVELDTEQAEKELNEQMIRYQDDKADFIKAETDVIITQSSVESDIRKAELDVKFAEMDLAKFEQIEREQEIRNAQIEIITAQESLKLAEDRLEWSEKLTEEGFETKSNLDRDKLSVTNQTLGLEKAQSVKEMLTEYDLAKMEAKYKSVLEEAKQELERVKKQGESKVMQIKASYDIEKRKLELSEIKLKQMQDQMAATKMYAPQDGMVVYAINENRYSNESIIEEGATIRQRQAIIKIPDTTAMKVEIKVHESHVNQVSLGQKAFVVLDAMPDARYAGRVSKIAVLPDPQSRYGNTNLKVYSTEILIEDKLPDLKPGASARAEIVIKNLEDVIKVPIQCVTTLKGKQVCYVRGLGGDKPVEVEIGMFNNKFIEIKS
ncbi:MAG: efflux RND transporter periplasmic adaptor subunit, partial [Verrucomicrobiae bacterium]|nr:efflux RND transporter periplasmic adaptor subunit [Verrucomicrobiae bacterium]